MKTQFEELGGTHLAEIDRVASKMFDRLVEQLKERDGITEELKA